MAADPCKPTTWTFETLYRHLMTLMDAHDRRYEERFQSQEKAMEAAMQAATTAILKAEASTGRRLELMNEFRATLSDKDRMMMPRQEIELITQRINERITVMQGQVDMLIGMKTGRYAMWLYVMGAAGLITAIAAILARDAGL